MKFLFTMLLISILSFTPNCQNTKNTSFLGVPGGGENGLWKAYTLYMILSLYGALPPYCPNSRKLLQLNTPVTGIKDDDYILSELILNDTITLKNTSSKLDNRIYLRFSICDSFGFRYFPYMSIQCNGKTALEVEPQGKGFCTVGSSYSNVLFEIRSNYGYYNNNTSYTIEVNR